MRLCLALGLPMLFLPVAAARSQAPAPCGPAPALLRSTQPNIFSEQQEQWLGDAMADQTDRFSQPVKNPALNAYVGQIGARLLGALPPTTFAFKYTLVESSEVNGFSLAGGHVYLTRKLVATARSEDELAGVIAHEMGHILTHQFAIETTADMRRLLGVTSVGDRADIYAKYQRLIDARLHDKHQTDADSDDKQDQADRVAVYATAAAGYRPQAYAEFWDHSFFVEGKTGSRFGDFFGMTQPSQKRLRKIRGIIAELPASCAAQTVATNDVKFRQWQQEVLQNQTVAAGPAATGARAVDGSMAALQGAIKDQPLQPFRTDVRYLRFSRDGKYILAQDDSSIHVLTREPFKEVFRIDAENALRAGFSPDSSQIAFTTPGLHVETWDLAAHKLVGAHEMVTRTPCFQVMLSPDARTVLCSYLDSDAHRIGFSLLDVGTGNVVFERKSWFEPSYGFVMALYRRESQGESCCHSACRPTAIWR